jgi:hypothetical protein
MKVSSDFRAALRLFACSVGSGSLGGDVLEEVDYLPVLTEGGFVLETVFAIWSNVIEIDADGKVLNEDKAELRAAQYVREFCDSTYVIDPPWEPWEVELHGP